jgi:hypothetical protein
MELNLQIPSVPYELLPQYRLANFSDEVSALWDEVVEEVLDEAHLTRHHSNTGTYDKGCRGPLCKKAYREHPRRRAPLEPGTLAPRYERAFDPIVEYFHTCIKNRVKKFQNEARQAV